MNLTLRRGIAAAAVALTVPTLSACQSNFNAPTDQVYTPGVGVNERSGSVDVLHAVIVSGSEGSGTVIAGLVNNDQQNGDALTGVQGVGEDTPVSVESSGENSLEPEGAVQLADEGNISITGEQIMPGEFVELQFTFQRGESVTLQVPVVERSGEFEDVPVPSS